MLAKSVSAAAAGVPDAGVRFKFQDKRRAVGHLHQFSEICEMEGEMEIEVESKMESEMKSELESEQVSSRHVDHSEEFLGQRQNKHIPGWQHLLLCVCDN